MKVSANSCLKAKCSNTPQNQEQEEKNGLKPVRSGDNTEKNLKGGGGRDPGFPQRKQNTRVRRLFLVLIIRNPSVSKPAESLGPAGTRPRPGQRCLLSLSRSSSDLRAGKAAAYPKNHILKPSPPWGEGEKNPL